MQEHGLRVILGNILTSELALNLVTRSSVVLEQSIIERLQCGLKDGFYIYFSSHFYSQPAEMKHSSLIPQHSCGEFFEFWEFLIWPRTMFEHIPCHFAY